MRQNMIIGLYPNSTDVFKITAPNLRKAQQWINIPTAGSHIYHSLSFFYRKSDRSADKTVHMSHDLHFSSLCSDVHAEPIYGVPSAKRPLFPYIGRSYCYLIALHCRYGPQLCYLLFQSSFIMFPIKSVHFYTFPSLFLLWPTFIFIFISPFGPDLLWIALTYFCV